MQKLAIGIDIGGTNIKAGLINSGGEALLFEKIHTRTDKRFEYTFSLIKALVQRLLRNAEGKGRVCGIGCASAGQIDHIKGKVVYATDNIPGLGGFELKKELEAAFNLPAIVENDVNAVALGEHWLGAARGLNDFVCLTLGTGIGGAIFRNGGIDYGAGDIAGELGHMCIKFDGIPCNCGNLGCFEKYGSVSALIESFSRRIENGETSLLCDTASGDLAGISGEMIFEAGEIGDKLASSVVNEYINYLSIGITSLLHILNPGAVVIGGGITRIGEKLIRPLREAVKAKAMPKFTENLLITNAQLGDRAGLCGTVRNMF